MADNILKLKVESSEYDAKLKKAAEGIRHLAEVAHKGGGELTGLEKAELDYIKALGDMETKSRTASGQVRELSNTYKELKVIYDQLNDVEKADEGGKALAASLETIRQRAIESKTQLDNATKSLESNEMAGKQDSSMLEQLAGKFTINIDALKLFNMGLKAASAALDVAKDAFFNNEEQLDEWGRTVESSESLYKGFLNAINTGDISGFLTNMSDIVKAARDAYDAMDALSTFNAFNQINVEKTRTGMTESIVNFREGSGTKEAVKAAGDAYKKELEERKRLEKDAYLSAVKETATQRGVSEKDLLDALSGTYGHYQDLKKVMPSGTGSQYVQAGVGGMGYYQTYNYAKNDQERLGEALRHLNDTELKSLQALGAQAERTGNEIAQVDKQIVRVLNGRQGGSSGSGGSGGKVNTNQPTWATGSIAAQEAEVSRLTKLWKEAGDAVRDDYAIQLSYAKQQLSEMTGGFNPGNVRPIADMTGRIPTPDFGSDWKKDKNGRWYDATAPVAPSEIKFSDGLKKQLESMNEKREVSLTKEVGNIASGVSGMLSGIEQLGFELPEGLKDVMGGIQGMISILTSISTIVTAIQAISAADAIIPFARGGIVPHAASGYFVPGNKFSTDATPIMANAGELVLNRSQQGNLAAALEGTGNGFKNGQIVGVIEGERLKLVLNNHFRRIGQGELVTW